jgi:hypothetical protein
MNIIQTKPIIITLTSLLLNEPTHPIPSSILNNGPNTDTRPLTEQTHESEPVYFISKHSKAKKDNIIFVH